MSAPRRSIILLSLGLIAVTALVVVLGQRQIALNQAFAELRRLSSTPHTGYGVPAFLAHTITGDTVTVGEVTDSSARQVLFLLTTTCPYCKATLPVWSDLADSLGRLGNRHVRVVALSLDSLRRTNAYAGEHRLRFSVATFPSEKLRRLYRAADVPQTVVLDAQGQVLYSHLGPLVAGPVLDSVYRAVAGKKGGALR